MAVVENVRELRSHHLPAHCSKAALPSWWRHFPQVQPEYLKPQLVTVALSCSGPGWSSQLHPEQQGSTMDAWFQMLSPKRETVSMSCWPLFSWWSPVCGFFNSYSEYPAGICALGFFCCFFFYPSLCHKISYLSSGESQEAHGWLLALEWWCLCPHHEWMDPRWQVHSQLSKLTEL